MLVIASHHNVLILELHRLAQVKRRDLLAFLGLLNNLFQLLNFFFVLLQESVLRVLVHSRLVLDVLGSGGVSKGGNRFFEVVVSWRDGSDHHCLGVATQ